jgi:hypothetical protein
MEFLRFSWFGTHFTCGEIFKLDKLINIQLIYFSMIINSRLTSFGYDEKDKTFFLKTTDPNYLKVLLAEDPLPEEIRFELPEAAIRQMCKYFSLWSKNIHNKLPEEFLA